MRAASDESPGQPSKHQYPELCKLHQLVSQLVRCSDITSECSTPTETPILLNIYGEPNLNVEDRPKLSKDAMQYLFQQTSLVFIRITIFLHFCQNSTKNSKVLISLLRPPQLHQKSNRGRACW